MFLLRMKWPNFMQNFPVLCGIYWFTGQLRCGPKTGCSVTECKNHWTVSWAISQRPRCIGQNINAKYFTISVANNYKPIHCNTKKQKHRQTFVRTNKHQMYKVYKGSRESLNKRLLPESYFMRLRRYYAVQGHSRWPMSVLIESPYATSY